MTLNLKCTQVVSLLTFYVRGKLEDTLKKMVKSHLGKCPICFEKYKALQKILNKTEETEVADFEKNEEVILEEAEVATISAYIDNELSDNENLRVKRNTISKLETRKTLEAFYAIRRNLLELFEKDRQNYKYDFSKFVLNQLDISEEINKLDPVINAVSLTIIFFILVGLFAGVILWI